MVFPEVESQLLVAARVLTKEEDCKSGRRTGAHPEVLSAAASWLLPVTRAEFRPSYQKRKLLSLKARSHSNSFLELALECRSVNS